MRRISAFAEVTTSRDAGNIYPAFSLRSVRSDSTRASVASGFIKATAPIRSTKLVNGGEAESNKVQTPMSEETQAEVARQNSDDDLFVAVNHDSAADHIGTALELKRPEFVAEHDAVGATAARHRFANARPRVGFTPRISKKSGATRAGQYRDHPLSGCQLARPPGVRRDCVKKLAGFPCGSKVQQRLGPETPEFAIQADDADPLGFRDGR